MEEITSDGEFRHSLLHRLWKFSLPALAITLSDPAMGLIDTICIGQLSTTTNLAALGPNTAIFNFLMNGLVFLSYSTMALLGDSQGSSSSNRQVASEKLGLMFMMGWGCGILLTLLLFFSSSSLIEHAGGLPGSDAWEPALAYIQGRLWAMPAVCTVIVCQSAMLAQGDAHTPCFATLVMLICNILLDYSVLYLELGMAGISWTTVLAQYCGAIALFLLLRQEGLLMPVFKRPSWELLCETLKTACILFFFKAFKNACFAFTQSSANSLGTDFAAAHQAIWALWMVAAFCPEPVSQAAQTFLPAWQTHKATIHQVPPVSSFFDSFKVGLATKIFVQVGAALGVLLGALTVLVVCVVPQVLTEDPKLWPLMASVWAPLGLSLLLVSPALVFDGVLLARKHFLYCTISMAVNTGIVVVFLEVGTRLEWGLQGVWWALVLVQGLRLIQGLAKIMLTPVTLRVPEGYAGVPLSE